MSYAKTATLKIDKFKLEEVPSHHEILVSEGVYDNKYSRNIEIIVLDNGDTLKIENNKTYKFNKQTEKYELIEDLYKEE